MSSSLEDKRRKKNAPISILSLPDDLVLSCMARVSRLYYPTLYNVSKRFRSLLASPKLHKTRSLLGHTETCIYVGREISPHNYKWFTLSRKPSSGYVLATVPVPSLRVESSSLVTVGSDIYSIPARTTAYQRQTSRVSILDCRTNTLREGPRLRVELGYDIYATVVDGKIYVAGNYIDRGSNSLIPSIQVLDTEKQIWDPIPIPCCTRLNSYIYIRKCACIHGKLHIISMKEEFAYDSKQGTWDTLGPTGAMGGFSFRVSDSDCEIDNVLYSACDGMLEWYDTELDEWRNLGGLVGLPINYDGSCVRLVGYGGNMVVFWEEVSRGELGYKKKIWCAEIALEKRISSEIWGIVQWFDHVLTDPQSFSFCHNFLKVLAVTV